MEQVENCYTFVFKRVYLTWWPDENIYRVITWRDDQTKIYTVWLLDEMTSENRYPLITWRDYQTKIYTLWILDAMIRRKYIPCDYLTRLPDENIYRVITWRDDHTKIYTVWLLDEMTRREYIPCDYLTRLPYENIYRVITWRDYQTKIYTLWLTTGIREIVFCWLLDINVTHGGCLIRNRNCMQVVSTWVDPRFFVGSALLIFLVVCGVLCYVVYSCVMLCCVV